MPPNPRLVGSVVVYQQIIQHALNATQPAGHLLTEIEILTKLLGLNAAYDVLGLLDQIIELLVGTDVEPAESLELWTARSSIQGIRSTWRLCNPCSSELTP